MAKSIEYPLRMPAEWEPHAATWLSWPHNRDSWPRNFSEAEKTFAQLVTIVAQSEPVHINVRDETMEQSAGRLLDAAGCDGIVTFHRIPTNDAWCRDHGAIFVHDAAGKLVALDWQYNAWGQKYPPFDDDQKVATQMATILELPKIELPMVLEGGSIEVDGRGRLMTSRSCLLNPNRNPTLDQAAIEQQLSRHFGVQDFVWLEDGIVGDDTDGHIDDTARFVPDNHIVIVVEENSRDDNYRPTQQNLDVLYRRVQELENGPGIRVLPMPPPIYYEDQRLPASYANFYITNHSVIVPTFAAASDAQAMDVLAISFPQRQIVGVDCRQLIRGLGAFHCLTQQVPRNQGVSLSS